MGSGPRRSSYLRPKQVTTRVRKHLGSAPCVPHSTRSLHSPPVCWVKDTKKHPSTFQPQRFLCKSLPLISLNLLLCVPTLDENILVGRNNNLMEGTGYFFTYEVMQFFSIPKQGLLKFFKTQVPGAAFASPIHLSKWCYCKWILLS